MKQNSLFIESEIGRKIKTSRINKKFTLEPLANQTGLPKGFLSKIEKSKKSPPLKPKKKTIYQHEGHENLFVLEGTMKFLHGGEELIVEEGDCVYFDSGIPYLGESMGNVAVKCFMSKNFLRKEKR